MNGRYNVLSVTSFIISVISILLAIWVLYSHCCLNYAGFILSVMTILITVLVAGQIWNAIDLRGKLNKIEQVENFSRAYAKYQSVAIKGSSIGQAQRFNMLIDVLAFSMNAGNQDVSILALEDISAMSGHNDIFNVNESDMPYYKSILKQASITFAGFDADKVISTIQTKDQASK